VEKKNFFQKIQELKNFQKKLIVFGLIAILGIILGFLVFKNFQKNLKFFQEKKFLEELNLPDKKEKLKDSFREIEEMFNATSSLD